jgi:serine/threonine protein kinase
VKQLKPEVKDVAVAINEIEGELKIHSLLDHHNIVSLFGAGFTTDKSRFLILERLDGGTITQQLGYDTRIRDRRRRFWKKQKMPYIRVLEVAEEIAQAMDYCHRFAVPGSMVLHRDLKPDNIGESTEHNYLYFKPDILWLLFRAYLTDFILLTQGSHLGGQSKLSTLDLHG